MMRPVTPYTVEELKIAVGDVRLVRSKRQRLNCRRRGHRSAGPLFTSDNKTDAARVTVTFSWTCVSCGLRFEHGFSVPKPDCDEARIAFNRLVADEMAALHLDVLHEVNLGRWERNQRPLREIPPDNAKREAMTRPALVKLYGQPFTSLESPPLVVPLRPSES